MKVSKSMIIEAREDGTIAMWRADTIYTDSTTELRWRMQENLTPSSQNRLYRWLRDMKGRDEVTFDVHLGSEGLGNGPAILGIQVIEWADD